MWFPAFRVIHAPTIRCTEILISPHLGPKRFRGGYRGICGARSGKRQSDFWTVDGHWLRAARWYLSTVDQVVNFQLVVSFDPYFCETHNIYIYICIYIYSLSLSLKPIHPTESPLTQWKKTNPPKAAIVAAPKSSFWATIDAWSAPA